MDNNLDIAVKFVLDREGGYVKDPIDPGGETKYGISKKSHRDLNIKDLTIEKAKEIYKKEYWDVLKLDTVELPYAIVCLDTAVNIGISHVFTWMTLLENAYDVRDRIRILLNYRLNYYNNLIKRKPSMEKFRHGWYNRVELLKEYIKTYLSS